MAMDKLISNLKNHRSPKVIYNKNKQYISITYDFDHGFIPKVRILAGRDIWLDWFCNIEQLEFDTIAPYLSRTPQKSRANLKQYAEKYTQDFTGDMLMCINYAITKHPQYPGNIKARGGSPYGLKQSSMDEIKNTARHLYVCLKNNLKKPTYQQPSNLKTLLKLHNIKPDSKKIREITFRIVERIFNFKPDISSCGGNEPHDVFYKNYIVYRSLKSMSDSKRITNFNSPFLIRLFLLSIIKFHFKLPI
jgi:hypothetical protein